VVRLRFNLKDGLKCIITGLKILEIGVFLGKFGGDTESLLDIDQIEKYLLLGMRKKQNSKLKKVMVKMLN
jgi:hypothetical protein